MNTALVTGASGALGIRLVARLIHEGWRVTALSRRPLTAPVASVVIADDPFNPDGAMRACDGVDVFFPLAASRNRSRSGVSLAAVNIDGTIAIARAARKRGVGRFVYFGSTAVYGNTAGLVATEQSTPAPNTEYGRTKLEGESAAIAEGPPAIVLRIAAVYGPQVRGNYLDLARICRAGLQITGENRRTLVYEDDLMAAALLATRVTAPGTLICNVPGGVHSLTAIGDAIATAIGSRRLRISAGLLAHVFRWLPTPDARAAKVTEDR